MSLFHAEPILANSAQMFWRGAERSGAIVKEEDCPIIVEKEELLFRISEFPRLFSGDNRSPEYSAQVTASYSFYNPADDTVQVTLAFPFGTVPDYGYRYNSGTGETDRSNDTEKYRITADGEPISCELRHTLILPGEDFDTDQQIEKLADGYGEDSFYAPELPVTKYTFSASEVDTETYSAATAAFEWHADSAKTKVFMEKQSGGELLNEGVRLDTWVDPGESFSVYILGENSEKDIPWKFYENGACEKEISGTMELVDKEILTFQEMALTRYPEESGIREDDWYRAVVETLNTFEWSQGAINSTDASLDVSDRLMGWYQYELTLASGERLLNTVTAPVYPDCQMNSEPPIYEYTYLLSPAKTWKKFGSLDIRMETPYELIESQPEGFEKKQDGYRLQLTELPEGELTFTLCTEQNPQMTDTIRRITGLPLAAGILVCIVAAAAVAVLWKKRKRAE